MSQEPGAGVRVGREARGAPDAGLEEVWLGTFPAPLA